MGQTTPGLSPIESFETAEIPASLPLELRHPLFRVGGDPFLRVVALEEDLLQFPLDGERGLAPPLWTARLMCPTARVALFGRVNCFA